jgi:hypothetical protein
VRLDLDQIIVFFPCGPGGHTGGEVIFLGLWRSRGEPIDWRLDGCFGESWRDVSLVEWISADANHKSCATPPFRCLAQGTCLRCRGHCGRFRHVGAPPTVVAASAPVSHSPYIQTLGGDRPMSRLLSFRAAQQQGMNSIGAEH